MWLGQERPDLSRSCLLREQLVKVKGKEDLAGFGSCSQCSPEIPELSGVRTREV